MGFVIVVAIAVTVGVLVYRLTDPGPLPEEPPAGLDPAGVDPAGLDPASVDPFGVDPARASQAQARPDDVREWAGGEVDDDASPRPRSPDPAGSQPIETGARSLPRVSSGSSWHARLGGTMGLVIAVGLGAIAIALAMYAAGTLIARLVSGVG